MSKKENYESKTEALLLPIAEKNHVEIYDVEYVKEGSEWYLRAYIDKEGGVSINDAKVESIDASFDADSLAGEGVIIKKGKKIFHRAFMK